MDIIFRALRTGQGGGGKARAAARAAEYFIGMRFQEGAEVLCFSGDGLIVWDGHSLVLDMALGSAYLIGIIGNRESVLSEVIRNAAEKGKYK